MTHSKYRFIGALFVLASVLLPQACDGGTPSNSKTANRRNSNENIPIAAQCDPNYSGCVPIDSDVDCAGGKGNGPAYVKGPVRVVGEDIYGLDDDDDGIGCE